MGVYIFKRMLITIPMLIAVSFITFLLVSFSPIEPAEIVLQAQEVPVITEELLHQTNEELGFNKPFLTQYLNWLKESLRFDFGDSYVKNESVMNLIQPAFSNTLKLTIASSIFIVIFSIVFGVICALHERQVVDRTLSAILMLLTAIPSYGLGALFIILFSVKLNLLPTSGMEDGLKSYVLPVIVLALGYIGIYFRTIRSAMLNQIQEDYVLYDRACGLSEGKITWHILRNSLQVAVSIFCMAIPLILGGTVVIENIFAWPGLGSLSLNAILSRDYPVIQAYVLIVTATFVVFNMLADMINVTLNPRLRSGDK